jgi:membrane-bound ClpP family serine protease
MLCRNLRKGIKLSLARRDAGATGLTALAVLAFIVTHEGWDVALIGDSHRWAAAVIIALGVGAYAANSTRRGSAAFGVLGAAALTFGALALATASLTPLSFLVIAIVVAWALATWRHVHAAPGQPAAT